MPCLYYKMEIFSIFFSYLLTIEYIKNEVLKYIMEPKNELKTVNSMVNIVSKKSADGTYEICLKESQYYYLPFDKNEINLSDERVRDQFIKAVERRVRRSKLYKAYIDYLKTDCKLTHCSVFGNIEADKKSKTKVEMHHGPIFTLYDIVSIVLEKHLREPHCEINTFDIAAEVLDLHRRKLVQTVMLCESVHKSMDNPKMAPFISLDQTFGDIFGFIKEYHEYFSPKHIASIKNYIMNYEKNLGNSEKRLNMFKPCFVKYNIKSVPNKRWSQ